ncbi:aspartic peptidase domain-containing protein [Alternaria rosae]|uniref:aspartic peptidase domain-containing protein n=1 Tax=Alternaria rosae TaxID=1187941 RepID=UPI001E8D65AC|nr:aspartic peptidase domain-containing protein [Alternaria rosae]KAH6882966.1 aspartic peptidase domain-containing protein [Alternaria rosae]
MPVEIDEYLSSYPDISEKGQEGNPNLASFGVDDVYLGKTAQDRKISSQYIAEAFWKRFQLGTLGLFPGSVGPPGAARPSLLLSLWNSRGIPSLSFGYTAGSSNRKTSASLVLGGYDSSRFDPATTTQWGFTIQNSTWFFIHLSAITINGVASWESAPEPEKRSLRTAFPIDSAIPQIWLPEEACVMFETAFGLVWDDTSELYLINDTTHTRLLRENPEVRFTIGLDNQATNYTLPYSAFDLRLTYPFVDTATYYFPLKRASEPAQHMLGRTFLQETYITVNYETQSFNLSQASHDSSSTNIVSIPSLSEPSQTSDLPLPSPTNSPEELSSAAYAGIGVGAGTLALSALCLIVAWKRKWVPFRRRKTSNGDGQNDHNKAELHGEHKPGIEAMEKERFELDAGSGKHEAMDREASELQTVENARELKGSGKVGVAEVQGSGLVHELPGHADDI